MNDQNKIRTFMLEFKVCSMSHLHSKDFSITVFQLYWLAQVENALCVSTVHLPELDEMLTPKRNHVGRRNLEFTYSQVTSECMWNKK